MCVFRQDTLMNLSVFSAPSTISPYKVPENAFLEEGGDVSDQGGKHIQERQQWERSPGIVPWTGTLRTPHL